MKILTLGVAVLGLYTAWDVACGADAAREELAHARHMLKEVSCTLPVAKQSMPEVVIDVEEPQTLAQKNNNPLNVKRPANGGRWKGQIGTDKFGHAQFKTQEYGIRAGALVLRTYARKHKVSTVEGLVARFAEGNQEGYVKTLCRRLRVKPDEKIDLVKRMPELLRAMVRQESGKDLPEHFFAPYDVVAAL